MRIANKYDLSDYPDYPYSLFSEHAAFQLPQAVSFEFLSSIGSPFSFNVLRYLFDRYIFVPLLLSKQAEVQASNILCHYQIVLSSFISVLLAFQFDL